MSTRIEEGSRVRSTEDFGPLLHEGVVKRIAISTSRVGPVAILSILIERMDGKEVVPHVHESPASFWMPVPEEGAAPPAKQETKPEGEVCVNCGEVHADKSPFTPEMFELFARFKTAYEHDKKQILIELAERFAIEISPNDPDVPDRVHKLLNRVEDAHEEAHRAMLKVGRMVARYLERHQAQQAAQGHIRRVVMMPVPPPTSDKGGNLN